MYVYIYFFVFFLSIFFDFTNNTDKVLPGRMKRKINSSSTGNIHRYVPILSNRNSGLEKKTDCPSSGQNLNPAVAEP
jgi:hypothetical protein